MKNNIVDVPASILRELRQSFNMSLPIAAKKIGVKPELLKVWEEEGIKISVQKARKIAEVYGKRHWSILLLDSIPKRKSLSKEYRRIQMSWNYSTETILAFRNAERILYLAESIEGRELNKNEIKSFKTTISSDISELTNKVREWLGVSIKIQRSFRDKYVALSTWIDSVEDKGIYVSQIPIATSEEVSAFTLSDNKRSVIVLNKSDTEKRRIFSLLHELSHILIDANSTFDIYDYNDIEAKNKIETFCNKFAGNLLIPDSIIGEYLNLIKSNVTESILVIGDKYKISRQTVLRRLYDYGLVDKRTFEKENKKLVEAYEKYKKSSKNKSFVADKMSYPRKVAKKNSFGLTEDVFEAYRTHSITYFEVSNLLGITPKHIPALESLVTNV